MSWFVFVNMGYDGGSIKTYENREEANIEVEDCKERVKLGHYDNWGLIEGKLIEGVLD